MGQLDVHLQDLESMDSSRRETAAKALFDLGAEARSAVPALLDALIAEPDACSWVGTAVVELRPTASDIPKLRAGLSSANDSVRFWTARAIVTLGPDAAPLTADLIRVLVDPNFPVTDSVLWALGTIGAASIQPLIEAATGADPKLRCMAVCALGRYPEHITSKLPTILTALDDRDATVRTSAAHAVCRLAQRSYCDVASYDSPTQRALTDALNRIIKDTSIDTAPDWPQRALDWLRHDP